MENMMKKALGALLTAVVVIGCGGGGGGVVAGIDRIGFSSGSVTGFGSIFVNGVEFETDTAEFNIDDDSVGSSQDDLDVGDIVIVTFDPDVPGIASTIFSDEAVQGPIDSINSMNSEITVAGQTVLIDGSTSFDDSINPPSLDGLSQGQFVEVHGLFDANGDIRATRIEPKPLGSEVEVHGTVSGLNTGTMQFMINALTVDYSTADTGDLSGGMPSEGDLVEAKGAINMGGTLVATKVEPDGLNAAGIDLDEFDDIEVEIEGLITRFNSETDFDVSGFPVTTNSGTVFEGGVAGDLGLNVKVEAEGKLNGSGVLVADKIDIRRGNDLRITALVDQVPPGSAPNTLVILGITVEVDDLTRFEDKSDEELEPFGLDDISVGNYVEVRGGAVPGSSNLIASLLEREDIPNPPGSETELRGIVETVDPPSSSFTIAGVTIVTDGGTSFAPPLTGVDDLQPGDLVDVDGTETGETELTAEEVTLEN